MSTSVASALVTLPVVYPVNPRTARGSLLAASAVTVVTGLALLATGHGLVEIFPPVKATR